MISMIYDNNSKNILCIVMHTVLMHTVPVLMYELRAKFVYLVEATE